MSKHTPGPWRIGDGGATVFGPKTNDGTLPEIVASLSRGLASEHTKANARLIAAAPELLAVAEAAAEYAEAQYRGPTAWGQLTSLGKQARAAIAKATE